MILAVLDPASYSLSIYAIPTLVISAAILLLGLLVLLRERVSPVSLSFLWVTLSLGMWLFGLSWAYSVTDSPIGLWWCRVAQVGVCFIPSATYQFSLTVLRINHRYKKPLFISWMTSALFAVATVQTDFLVGGVYHYWWGYYTKYGWLGLPFLGFFFSMMIAALRHLWVEYRKAKPGTLHQKRARGFTIAFALAYLGSVDFIPVYGIPLYPFGYITAFIFLVMTARIIWRYRLTDFTPGFAAQKIMDTMADPLLVLDPQGVVRIANNAAGRFFNEPEGKLVGRSAAEICRPVFGGDQISTLVRREAVQDYEMTLIRDEGEPKVLSLSTSVMKDQDDQPVAIVCIGRDVTDRKRAEARLDYMANYDSLTQLPNRAMFVDRLSQALTRAPWHKRLVGVLFLDLDHFKRINDTLGHKMGDELLKAAAGRLRACVREGDTVARLGGDEFTIILADVARSQDIARVARKILEAMSGPFELDGHELFVTTSIGISLFPNDGEDTETLLKKADMAMYRAKEQGRNNYQHYSPDMDARASERLAMESDLRHALERDEFVLHYQPLMDLKTGKISGLEALLRWQHPERGLIPPAEFIPLAEDTGLIVPIGEWVLRTVAEQNKAWQAAGLRPVRLAVNISFRQFKDQELVNTVGRILKETGLSPKYLELELTESSIMKNVEEAIETLGRLSELGIAIAIDDFGTGYSSLSYLKRFPINTLKVDRSFVQDITTDPDDRVIVTTIILMAHSLNMKVIAEGVETVEQLEYLSSLKCHEAQGFLLSKPVPAEEAGKLLKGEKLYRIHADD